MVVNVRVLARFRLEGILKLLPILDIDVTVLWDYVEKQWYTLSGLNLDR